MPFVTLVVECVGLGPESHCVGPLQRHGTWQRCQSLEVGAGDLHEYDYVITTAKMISPTTEISSKLSAMADKSRAMCDAGTGPLFDLIVCDEAHHAVAATWVAVFQALGDIGQKYMKAEKSRSFFPSSCC